MGHVRDIIKTNLSRDINSDRSFKNNEKSTEDKFSPCLTPILLEKDPDFKFPILSAVVYL